VRASRLVRPKKGELTKADAAAGPNIQRISASLNSPIRQPIGGPRSVPKVKRGEGFVIEVLSQRLRPNPYQFPGSATWKISIHYRAGMAVCRRTRKKHLAQNSEPELFAAGWQGNCSSVNGAYLDC